MSALPRSKVPQLSRGRAAGQPVVLRRPSVRGAVVAARHHYRRPRPRSAEVHRRRQAQDAP
jgi:hypothetical protein